ncbi:MAG: hypothetical protein P8I51_03075 [Polaribacter sp.]|jgi:uncharacterized membrane protein|nr:hypothetical protein [Polaribacter sp.]MDG1953859.1 hypothetical protein [Polaribacter sp.]MDG2073542.1 hypothetical protein [Polaribacter sp.]
MKSIFNKIASISMAFLVLLSTMSFTVEKHYCGDFLVDVSIIGNADSCDMKMDLSDSNNCCKDEIYHIEGQDKLQKNSTDDLSLNQQKIIIALVISYQTIFVDVDLEKEFYKDFSPPDILQDYQVLYQSFLI